MANIRVDASYTIVNGSEVVFVAPCDCNQISGIKVYYPDGSKVFTFKDAHGNTLTGLGNLFAAGAYVKAILDVTNGFAYIQNADTNKYLEDKFENLQTAAGAVPVNHASSETKYGTGNSSNYGHVKLSDATNSTSGASGGIAATPAAVKAAYDLAKGKANTEHKHTKSEITDFPTNMTPTAHNQAASTITAGTFGGQVVANSGGQAVGTSLLRNSKLVSADTNPTVNGEICWTYK